MARTSKKGPKFRIKPLVDFMGLKETVEQIGEDELLGHIAADPKLRKKALAFFLRNLSDQERGELKRNLK